MKPLTKSLHTVTAVCNVAAIVATDDDTPNELAAKALAVLGYNLADYAADDPTIVQIIKNCRKLIEG